MKKNEQEPIKEKESANKTVELIDEGKCSEPVSTKETKEKLKQSKEFEKRQTTRDIEFNKEVSSLEK